MDADILKGTLVRLTAIEPELMAKEISQWERDSEYQRLSMVDPANQISVKKLTEWMQKDQESNPPRRYEFAIHMLVGDHLLGGCGIGGGFLPHGEGFVGIGIGERELWSKGFGTDAMMVILRFGFQELNLRRVALTCSEYNPRAICSYEKAGFIQEGRARGFFLREGRRWDMVFMGILREEWLSRVGLTS